MNLKRKHHFVSQFYLKSWYNDNKKIIAWDGRNIFPLSTRAIAYENDLYELTSLTSEQIHLFDEYISAINLTETSTYKLFVKNILGLQSLLGNSLDLLKSLNLEISDKFDDLEKEMSFNILEDKFSFQEDSFSKVLSKILLEDKPSITMNNYDVLISFFMFQLTKTPKKLNEVFKIHNEQITFENVVFTEKEHRTFILLLTQCLSEGFYLSFISKLYRIKIYQNISTINFITSDDPCFNQIYDEGGLMIQLPISPRTMLELVANDHDEEYIESMTKYFVFHKEEANNIILDESFITFHEYEEKDVIELNKKIFQNKDRFIYAQSRNDIVSLDAVVSA